jgi:hypothetical protein
MTAFESNESSSPIVTRAVAAGLVGQFCNNYEFPAWQKTLLTVLGAFPQGVAQFVISRFESISGLPPEILDDFSVDDLIRQRLGDYAHLTGKFPAITVGAALGGATTYLSLAVGGPFLPQTFVTTLKRGSLTSDVNEYLRRSLEVALRLTDENPGLMTIQHYDPIHDGWMTRFVNHLRFKLLDLPPLMSNLSSPGWSRAERSSFWREALPGCATGLDRAAFSRLVVGVAYLRRSYWKGVPASVSTPCMLGYQTQIGSLAITLLSAAQNPNGAPSQGLLKRWNLFASARGFAL